MDYVHNENQHAKKISCFGRFCVKEARRSEAMPDEKCYLYPSTIGFVVGLRFQSARYAFGCDVELLKWEIPEEQRSILCTRCLVV